MLLLLVCLSLLSAMRGNKRLLRQSAAKASPYKVPKPHNHKGEAVAAMSLDDAAEGGSSSSSLLFSLGPLRAHTCLSRPSVVVKSPYVADTLLGANKNIPLLLKYDRKSVTAKNKTKTERLHIEEYIRGLGDAVTLTHAPSLDCAGCVIPGTTVYCSASKNDSTKTRATIQLCEEVRDSDGGTSLIGYHPSIAETAAKAMLDRRLIGHKVGSYEKVEKQKTYLDSRVDFVLVNDSDGVLTLVEVKNVVGADYFVGEVPAERCEVGVYTRERRLPSDGRHAIFPHGAAKPGLGVVSERAIKHVHGLTLLQGSTDAATGYSVRCMVLFIINRSDCEAFRPCHEADLLFAQVLYRAASRGVVVAAQEISIDSSTGDVSMSRELPVIFDACVSETTIDETLLQRVLGFANS